jgi:hypothetical protein
VKQLKEWTDAGIPVIIAWNPEGREWSHASVVFDVDDEFNVSVADPNIPDPDETVRVVPKAEFYKKWFEKWPDYLVRRPAMAIAREVTQDGRQVMASEKASILIPLVVHETARRKGLPPRKPVDLEKDAWPEGRPSWNKAKGEDPKPKSLWERIRDKLAEVEMDKIAGKKERRSIKDKAMARKIKHGPESHEEKSDDAAAMERAMWNARKEEGHAGLPGAGMGAGPHKDKSKYDRKREKNMDKEASLTQPLMTRRDYEAETMDTSDYAKALKTAENLPADVERYVEEGKAQGLDEAEAWAVAWSRWCKYKKPGDSHCQMSPSEYFPGKTAGLKLKWELNRAIPAHYAETEFGTYWVTLTAGDGSPDFYSVKLDNTNVGWKPKLPAAMALAESDYQKRLPGRKAKFEKDSVLLSLESFRKMLP